MKRGLLTGTLAAIAALLAFAAPVTAHGDHDARPLARNLEAGPHRISLWQVYPDIGDAMMPHLIVMFEDGTAAAKAANVSVTVNGTPAEVHRSASSSNGWETAVGIAVGDRVAVTIRDGTGSWALEPLVVTPSPISIVPMEELIYISIVLTAATAWWVVGRTARAWRRPAVGAV
jgi:hypothetical protein